MPARRKSRINASNDLATTTFATKKVIHTYSKAHPRQFINKHHFLTPDTPHYETLELPSHRVRDIEGSAHISNISPQNEGQEPALQKGEASLATPLGALLPKFESTGINTSQEPQKGTAALSLDLTEATVSKPVPAVKVKAKRKRGRTGKGRKKPRRKKETKAKATPIPAMVPEQPSPGAREEDATVVDDQENVGVQSRNLEPVDMEMTCKTNSCAQRSPAQSVLEQMKHFMEMIASGRKYIHNVISHSQDKAPISTVHEDISLVSLEPSLEKTLLPEVGESNKPSDRDVLESKCTALQESPRSNPSTPMDHAASMLEAHTPYAEDNDSMSEKEKLGMEAVRVKDDSTSVGHENMKTRNMDMNPSKAEAKRDRSVSLNKHTENASTEPGINTVEQHSELEVHENVAVTENSRQESMEVQNEVNRSNQHSRAEVQAATVRDKSKTDARDPTSEKSKTGVNSVEQCSEVEALRMRNEKVLPVDMETGVISDEELSDIETRRAGDEWSGANENALHIQSGYWPAGELQMPLSLLDISNGSSSGEDVQTIIESLQKAKKKDDALLRSMPMKSLRSKRKNRALSTAKRSRKSKTTVPADSERCLQLSQDLSASKRPKLCSPAHIKGPSAQKRKTPSASSLAVSGRSREYSQVMSASKRPKPCSHAQSEGRSDQELASSSALNLLSPVVMVSGKSTAALSHTVREEDMPGHSKQDRISNNSLEVYFSGLHMTPVPVVGAQPVQGMASLSPIEACGSHMDAGQGAAMAAVEGSPDFLPVATTPSIRISHPKTSMPMTPFQTDRTDQPKTSTPMTPFQTDQPKTSTPMIQFQTDRTDQPKTSTPMIPFQTDQPKTSTPIIPCQTDRTDQLKTSTPMIQFQTDRTDQPKTSTPGDCEPAKAARAGLHVPEDSHLSYTVGSTMERLLDFDEIGFQASEVLEEPTPLSVKDRDTQLSNHNDSFGFRKAFSSPTGEVKAQGRKKGAAILKQAQPCSSLPRQTKQPRQKTEKNRRTQKAKKDRKMLQSSGMKRSSGATKTTSARKRKKLCLPCTYHRWDFTLGDSYTLSSQTKSVRCSPSYQEDRDHPACVLALLSETAPLEQPRCHMNRSHERKDYPVCVLSLLSQRAIPAGSRLHS